MVNEGMGRGDERCLNTRRSRFMLLFACCLQNEGDRREVSKKYIGGVAGTAAGNTNSVRL